jgi:hypothetical protein
MFVIAAFALAGGVSPAAHASDFTWQQLYQCSLFASSVSELMIDQGRDGTEFEKEFDALVAAALNLHRAAYSREHPSAPPDDWSRAWEADTARLEDAFVDDVDASASALDFLKAGYKGCRPEGAHVLMRNRGPTAKD